MEIVYLPSAAEGLAWFRSYYTEVFSEGEKRATVQYEKTKKILLATPRVGHPIGERDSREYVIPKTPFSLVYRIRGEQIQIMLVLDQRANHPPIA
ncbi:MAG: type II toxin-antitoxin system RelE/ParE family toxin [Patescibacteria group bacterium]